MPFNLLILPLVGGYYVIANSEWFKYKTQRLHSERLLFNSIMAGILLTVASFVIKFLGIEYFPKLVGFYRNIMPLKANFVGVTFFSFVLGIVGTEITNLITSETQRILVAIDSIGNELEKILEMSATERRLIQITLKNEKVYVGICGRIPKPDKTTYFVLIPFLSGFRDPATKKITFNTDYLEVYSSYIRSGDATAIEELNTELIIKTDEVLILSRFDKDVFERFTKTS